MRYKLEYIVFIVLIFIIILPMMIFGEYHQNQSSYEAKKLAPLPTVFVTNERFPKDTDDFLNDRFGLREYLVSMYEHTPFLQAWLFDISGKTLLGKDGWLYMNDTGSDKYGRRIENYLHFSGQAQYTEDEIKSIVSHIERVNTWCKDNGIKLITTFPPIKHSIYPEYYSPVFKAYKDNGYYNDIMSRFKRAGVDVAEVKEELIKNKDNGLLYLKQDTHWNSHAGYIGYLSLMNEIRKYFPSVHIVNRNDFDYVDRGFVVGVDGNTTKPGLYLPIIDRDEVAEFKDNISIEYLKKDDRNHATTNDYCQITSSSAGGPTIFMVRDSFSVAMVPFLERSSSKLTTRRISWAASPLIYKEDILSDKPDIIILEIQERYLRRISSGYFTVSEAKRIF